jgi:hypothetical protein
VGAVDYLLLNPVAQAAPLESRNRVWLWGRRRSEEGKAADGAEGDARFATRGCSDGAGGGETEGDRCRRESVGGSPPPRGGCALAAMAKAPIIAHAPGHTGGGVGNAEPTAHGGEQKVRSIGSCTRRRGDAQ